jgi:hypothetical protein
MASEQDPHTDVASLFFHFGDFEDFEAWHELYGVALSDKQTGMLETWIRNSEDPAPTFKDAKQKAKILFNKDIPFHQELDIRRCLYARILNGPPVSYYSHL